MLFVEYPKCSTCRKAKQWLKDNGIDFTDRDITVQNPTGQELRQWQARSGLPLRSALQVPPSQRETLRHERGGTDCASCIGRHAGQASHRCGGGHRPCGVQACGMGAGAQITGPADSLKKVRPGKEAAFPGFFCYSRLQNQIASLSNCSNATIPLGKIQLPGDCHSFGGML